MKIRQVAQTLLEGTHTRTSQVLNM